MKIAGFVGANRELLMQLDQVLSRIDGEQYAQHLSDVFDASLGGHVRHLLDHYENFFSSVLETYPSEPDELRLSDRRPMVNYDSRQRDRLVEVELDVARGRIERICQTLESMPRKDVEVDIILQIDHAPENALQRTTLARELSFLHSHSVHHMAIISYMLRAMGVDDMPNTFGIAPSTIKYREAM